jgi:hypothetical protein
VDSYGEVAMRDGPVGRNPCSRGMVKGSNGIWAGVIGL